MNLNSPFLTALAIVLIALGALHLVLSLASAFVPAWMMWGG